MRGFRHLIGLLVVAGNFVSVQVWLKLDVGMRDFHRLHRWASSLGCIGFIGFHWLHHWLHRAALSRGIIGNDRLHHWLHWLHHAASLWGCYRYTALHVTPVCSTNDRKVSNIWCSSWFWISFKSLVSHWFLRLFWMTGEYVQGCIAHAWLAVQGCICLRGCGAWAWAGVGQWGVGRYMYTATHKNQENRVVNH